jgi:hypothetical protein
VQHNYSVNGSNITYNGELYQILTLTTSKMVWYQQNTVGTTKEEVWINFKR